MRRILSFLAFAATLLTFGPACAGTVRIEWMRNGVVFSAETVTSTGASVQSGAAPDFGGVAGQARVIPLSGAVIVAPAAANPTATQTNGVRLQAGDGPVVLPIPSGYKLAVIEAADGVGQTPLGYQQITSLSASTALTVPSGATAAVVTVESQAVRWRDDGTAPTAGAGQPLSAGQSMTIRGAAALAAVRFIEQAASAKLNVSYYK